MAKYILHRYEEEMANCFQFLITYADPPPLRPLATLPVILPTPGSPFAENLEGDDEKQEYGISQLVIS
jgi:hypothetical protein